MCTKSGKSCTKRLCNFSLPRVEEVSGCLDSEGTRREEGESWDEDCNSCMCTNSGSSCTKRLCNFAAPFLTSSVRVEEDSQCLDREGTTREIGDRWTENCNNCMCTKSGSSCTKKLCNFELGLPCTDEQNITRQHSGSWIEVPSPPEVIKEVADVQLVWLSDLSMEIQLSECCLVMFCSSVHGRPISKLHSFFVQLLPDFVHVQLLQSSVQLSPTSRVVPSLSRHWESSSVLTLEVRKGAAKLQILLVQLLPEFVHMQLLQSSSQLSPSSLLVPSLSKHPETSSILGTEKLQSLFVQLFPDLVHMQLLQSSLQLSPSTFVAPSLSVQSISPVEEANIAPVCSSSSSRAWQLTSPLLQEQSLISPWTSMFEASSSSPPSRPQSSAHSSHFSRCSLRFPLSSTHSCSYLLTQNLRVQTGTPLEVHLQLLHSSFQESPTRLGFPSLSSPHWAADVTAFVILSVQEAVPWVQVHTFRSCPVFSSQVLPSEQVLPSSQFSRSLQILLVHPGVPLGRQRQLLHPSGLQESPTCLVLPSLSTPHPPALASWGLPFTRTAVVPKSKSVVAHFNCISLSPPFSFSLGTCFCACCRQQ